MSLCRLSTLAVVKFQGGNTLVRVASSLLLPLAPDYEKMSFRRSRGAAVLLEPAARLSSFQGHQAALPSVKLASRHGQDL